MTQISAKSIKRAAIHEGTDIVGIAISDSDAQFWIDWLIKDGKIQEGQFKPSDIYTNQFNLYYK